MRLVDLDPAYITMPTRKEGENWIYRETEKGPIDAGGIKFDCPECRLHPENDEWGNVDGSHRLILYVPKAFDSDPKIGPGRWSLVGSNFEDISLVGSSKSSVLCRYGCHAHFFVEKGSIRMCGDSGVQPKEKEAPVQSSPANMQPANSRMRDSKYPKSILED